MKTMFQNTLRLVGLGALTLTSLTAQAHTGHGTSGLEQGLLHPFGLDHLLAMVAVGVWSVSVLPASQAWRGPATFMIGLIVSALLGVAGVTVPYLESLISLSVVLLGAMLIVSRTELPPSVGLTLIAMAAAFHGLAHGAESPQSGFAAYAIGFLVATGVLHLGGVLAGLGIRHYFFNRAAWVTRILGAGCAGTGVYLLGQV